MSESRFDDRSGNPKLVRVSGAGVSPRMLRLQRRLLSPKMQNMIASMRATKVEAIDGSANN